MGAAGKRSMGSLEYNFRNKISETTPHHHDLCQNTREWLVIGMQTEPGVPRTPHTQKLNKKVMYITYYIT